MDSRSGLWPSAATPVEITACNLSTSTTIELAPGSQFQLECFSAPTATINCSNTS